jgi:hypothetical protein
MRLESFLSLSLSVSVSVSVSDFVSCLEGKINTQKCVYLEFRCNVTTKNYHNWVQHFYYVQFWLLFIEHLSARTKIKFKLGKLMLSCTNGWNYFVPTIFFFRTKMGSSNFNFLFHQNYFFSRFQVSKLVSIKSDDQTRMDCSLLSSYKQK